MKSHPLAKYNRIFSRRLIFVTLIAAACFVAIALFNSTSQPTQQAKGGIDANPQPSLVIPSPNDTGINSASQTTEESKLFSSESNRKPFKTTKAHQLFPNNSQGKSVENAQEHQVFPSSLQPKVTVQDQQVNKEIPEGNVTPTLEPVQEPQIEAVTQELPEWELQPETFPVPTEFRGKIIKRIIPPAQEKVIALTFDDGPSPYNTLPVLEILQQNHIKATFFWVGKNLKAYPKIAKQVITDGHAIGNHTWHHWYHQMDRSTAAREIDSTAELIYKSMDITTPLFRPPGGVLSNGLADYAKIKQYVTVMWSVDPMDYRQRPANDLVKTVITQAQPGAIVLMHDGGGRHSATVEALPHIITKLQELGYRFVTVPELLEMRDLQQPEGL